MKHKPLDKTGIWLAIVCAIHCLLVPVVLPTLSLVGLSFLGADMIERGILMVSALIGGVAISIGTKHHKSGLPIILLIAGVVLYFHKHQIGHHFGHGWEVPVVLVGAALLISAHVLNLHLCRVRKASNCDVAAEAQGEEVGAESTTPSPAYDAASERARLS